MFSLIRLIVITTSLASVASAQVAVRIGKNHAQVKRLFRPVIARANQSTVRILSGPRGEDVALGTIVRSDGYVLTRGDGLPQRLSCQLPDGRRVAAERIEEIADHHLVLLRVAARDLPVIAWRQGPGPSLGSLLATPGRGLNPVAIGIVSSEISSALDPPGDGRLQHDTILRPIDCGGPVVDLNGLAVGVNLTRADRVTTIALSAAAIRDVLKRVGLDAKNQAQTEGQGRGAVPRRSTAQVAPSGLRELEAKIRKAAAEAVACTVAIQIGTTRGSGVIASPEGYILTAAHVCPGAKTKANIQMQDGRTATGTCRGADRAADAGLIQLDGTGPWPHADTSRWPLAKRGQWCLATGYPHGRRSGHPPVVRLGRVLDRGVDAIMTDCTLTQGDSGGPLFDLDGHLLGIHSRIGRHLAKNVHVPADRFRTDWLRLNRGDVWGETPRTAQPHPP
jgi:S1-C subfamily serine protease